MSATATAHAPGLEAAPAELPLTGGQPDATLTLQPLLSAVMRSPRAWFERTDGPTASLKALGLGGSAQEMIDVPIVAFLLEHPTAGLVLVDTGFHRSIAEGRSRERSLQPRGSGPADDTWDAHGSGAGGGGAAAGARHRSA